MSNKDDDGRTLAIIFMMGSVAIGLFFTAVTGSLWQWIPIIAALVVCFRVATAIGDGKDKK